MNPAQSKDKDIRRLLGGLQRQGCEISRGRSGHWRVTGPNGQSITMSSTPGDQRTLKNIRADAKRYLGIVL